MSNEYIQFSKPRNLETLLNDIKNIDIEAILSKVISMSTNYIGISDGRYPEENTICFIDREVTDSTLGSYKNILILTTKEFHNNFKTNTALYSKDPRELFIKLLEVYSKNKICMAFTSTITNKMPTISSEANIHENVIIEDAVSVGKGSTIYAGVILKRGTIIGENCIIRENSTIGCNGIALYKTTSDETIRFPHLAGVHIKNNVEIGSGVVIVKGTLHNTFINNDTVIGNLCNIGHGVKISTKVWISVGTLIGGNCNILQNSTIGLGVNIKDNLTIGENTSVGMGSVVTKNLPSNISVFGNPAKKIRSLSTGPKR